MQDLWWAKWHCDRFLSQYFAFPLSVSLHQCFVLIFILALLLSEGQAGEAWEPSKICVLSDTGTVGPKSTFTFCSLERAKFVTIEQIFIGFSNACYAPNANYPA
jgi:fluoride ion exporter CrcB/FEX